MDAEDVFQGRHRAGSYFGDVVLHPGDHPADAVDKALDHLPAQVQHGLGQLLHPVVQGIDNGFRGAGNKRPGPLDTVADGRHDLLAEVEPVERQEHVDDGVQDFRDVGHQSGDGLDQALGQSGDDLHPGGQNLGGVVIDDPRQVGDDPGGLLDEGGQPLGDALGQRDDQRKPLVHQLAGTLPQPGGKVGQGLQSCVHQLGQVCLDTLFQGGQQVGRRRLHLGQDGRKPAGNGRAQTAQATQRLRQLGHQLARLLGCKRKSLLHGLPGGQGAVGQAGEQACHLLHGGDEGVQHGLALDGGKLPPGLVQVALDVGPAVGLAGRLAHCAGQLLPVLDHLQQCLLLLNLGQVVELLAEHLEGLGVAGGLGG